MPTINGRLVCCVCGTDLGSAADPYRDPDCPRCLREEIGLAPRDRDPITSVESQTYIDTGIRPLEGESEAEYLARLVRLLTMPAPTSGVDGTPSRECDGVCEEPDGPVRRCRLLGAWSSDFHEEWLCTACQQGARDNGFEVEVLDDE